VAAFGNPIQKLENQALIEYQFNGYVFEGISSTQTTTYAIVIGEDSLRENELILSFQENCL
jgi:hypothetical protein